MNIIMNALIWVLGLVGLAGPLERWLERREAIRLFDDMKAAAMLAREDLIERGEIDLELLEFIAASTQEIRVAMHKGSLEDPDADELLEYTNQLVRKHYEFESKGMVEPTLH